MDDLADVFNTENVREGPAFKKPVLIGKRPGVKVIQSQSLSKTSDENHIVTERKTEETDNVNNHQNINDTVGTLKPIHSTPVPSGNVNPLNYSVPNWSGMCVEPFLLEILKNGTIIQSEDLRSQRAYYVFGRLPTSNFVLEHPSISRCHAVLQYQSNTDENDSDKACQDKGWYLYDLGSTHGTFLNKERIVPNVYHRVRTGHVFKFGSSTRIFVLQGPCEDQEEESELSVTQLKELREKRELAELNSMYTQKVAPLASDKDVSASAISSSSDGVDWGMGEDAQDENPLAENPFAIMDEGLQNEDLYLDDPKKTLRGWFEREGYELEYKVEEKSYAHFVCRVELPVEVGNGRSAVAEASVKGGKKKEAVVQCALEACRILDRYGLLRQANHESKVNRKKRKLDEDEYSSDEDSFLDRTGAAEKKRLSKLKGKVSNSIETFDSLVAKLKNIETEIAETQQLLTLNAVSKVPVDQIAEDDDLDSYIASLKNESLKPKKSNAALKVKLQQLEKEKANLKVLINVAKPALLPALSAELPVRLSEDDGGKNIKNETVTPSQSAENQIASNQHKPSSSAVKSKSNLSSESSSGTNTAAEPSSEAISDGRRELKSLVPSSNSLPVEPKNARSEVANKLQVQTTAVCDQSSSSKSSEVNTDKSGLVIRKRKKAKVTKQEAPQSKVEYDASDPTKFAMWMPPDDQSGDGKNSLNRKLGY